LYTMYEELVCAIFAQAAKDYADLRKRGVSKSQTLHGDGYYSIKEIEKFFVSPWGAMLLRGIGCKLNGRDVLKMVRKRYSKMKAEEALTA